MFARAAAVVTNGGTPAVLASLVARDYGTPSVVGTGVATVGLRQVAGVRAAACISCQSPCGSPRSRPPAPSA
ncbi:PEP-utilizing enzyme, partial [Catellatospora paridis]